MLQAGHQYCWPSILLAITGAPCWPCASSGCSRTSPSSSRPRQRQTCTGGWGNFRAPHKHIFLFRWGETVTGIGDNDTGIGATDTGIGATDTGIGDSNTGLGDTDTGISNDASVSIIWVGLELLGQ